MMIKLAIIATIIVIGVILFSTELQGTLFKTSKLSDSLSTDLNQVKEKVHTVKGKIGYTMINIENKIGDTLESVNSNFANFKDDSISTISSSINKISSFRITNDKETNELEPIEMQP